jgi:hypothetical protein
VVIPCDLYLPHGALVEFFTLSWAVERWNLSSMSLLLSLFLKSIGEITIAVILWFLNIRHLCTLFGMWFLTSAVTPRCYCSSYSTSTIASTIFIQWWLQYEPNSMKMVFSTNGVGLFWVILKVWIFELLWSVDHWAQSTIFRNLMEWN